MATTTHRWWTGALAPVDWAALAWPAPVPAAIRVEEYLDGDLFVPQAEVPGVDPNRDLRLTLDGGLLRLAVERVGQARDRLRTEFHYGTFTRTVVLPARARPETVTATYAGGILTVTVALTDLDATVVPIPIEVRGGDA